MSSARRDLITAILLSTAAAVLADLSPPSLEDTTSFIATAIRQHHVRPIHTESEERGWRMDAFFAGCSIETRVSSEVYEVGKWTTRAHVARWQAHETDDAAIVVTRDSLAPARPFVVTLPCAASHACVDRGPHGRDSAAHLAFTSEVIALRVAAAFRHAAALCRDLPMPSASGGG
jgi:hypothetical protein